MELLAKIFAKEVDTNNHFDYFLSAYISKKIMESNQLFDGIIYPSVQERLLLSNCAVKSNILDSKFDLIKVHEITITEVHGKGVFFKTLARSEKGNFQDGRIAWDWESETE